MALVARMSPADATGTVTPNPCDGPLAQVLAARIGSVVAAPPALRRRPQSGPGLSVAVEFAAGGAMPMLSSNMAQQLVRAQAHHAYLSRVAQRARVVTQVAHEGPQHVAAVRVSGQVRDLPQWKVRLEDRKLHGEHEALPGHDASKRQADFI